MKILFGPRDVGPYLSGREDQEGSKDLDAHRGSRGPWVVSSTFDSFKKRTKLTILSTEGAQDSEFRLGFFEESRTPLFAFEIY